MRLEDNSPPREGGVEALRRKVERRSVGLDELDVGDAGGCGAVTPVAEHLRRDVRGDYLTVRAGRPRRGQRRLACPGGDVENAVSWPDPGHLDEPLADRRRGAVDQLLPVVPTLCRGPPVPSLTCTKLAGVDLRGFHRKLLSQRFGRT